ncbi:hypothetical protein FQZ97_1221600 [compost metagenome]
MHRRHPLLADGIAFCDEALIGGNRRVVHARVEIGRRFPGLLVGVAHDDVEANAVLKLTLVFCCADLHRLDLVPDLLGRLAPGQIGIDVLGRDIDRLVR